MSVKPLLWIRAERKRNVNMKRGMLIERTPICPVCGEECDTLYIDRFGEYIGCNVCIEEKDAWELMEEQRHD